MVRNKKQEVYAKDVIDLEDLRCIFGFILLGIVLICISAGIFYGLAEAECCDNVNDLSCTGFAQLGMIIAGLFAVILGVVGLVFLFSVLWDSWGQSFTVTK